MQIKYCCTYWGCENDKPDVFVEKVLSAGYEGIELFMPAASDEFAALFMKKLNDVQHKNPGYFHCATTYIARQLHS